MDYIKVKGNENLIRDTKTNSIINRNMAEYKEYMRRKKLKSEDNQKIENLESDVASIKSDLEEIKHLLRELIK